MHAYEQVNHNHLIHRGDFIDALLSVLPEGMVHLGHKLETIEDNGDHATLTFENGETVTADLVIGADGIRSTVRKQLFSDKEPVFSGEHAYRAVISIDDAHGLVTDDNLAHVHGPERHHRLHPAAAPPRAALLRHHRPVRRRHRGRRRSPRTTW